MNAPLIRAFLRPAVLILGAALAGASAPARGQNSSSAAGEEAPAGANSAASDNGQEQTVKMSAFEVTTTQGHGYVSTNAATAFKTDESLMSLPQADLVVTSDMIADLTYENATDILQYLGVASGGQGSFVYLRGNASISLPYMDEMPQFAIFEDDAIIDSYEVVKGPAQTLYLNAGLSGIVLEATKKPLPFDQRIFTGSVDDNGLFRLTADLTGPIGKVGDLDLNYRIVAVYQKGDTYFMNIKDDRNVLFPELQLKYHNTTIRAYYNLQTIHAETAGFDILTPNGNLYTGAGRKEANQPPNNMDEYEDKTTYVELLQKISDSWEMRLEGAYWDYDTYGPLAYASNVDWDNQTEDFTARLNNEKWKYWTVFDDFQGHYGFALGGREIENRDALGFAFSEWTDRQAYWSTAPFGTNDSITVPVNSAAAINNLVVPNWTQFGPPTPAQGGIGDRIDTTLSAIYWQHTIDIIPDWLTLAAGLTWDNVAIQSIPDIGVLPWQTTDEPYSQWIHRLAAVVHLTKNVSLYGLSSTTFVPASNGALLENGQLPPPEAGRGNELGLKWNFLGGKISGEAAWFKETTLNGLNYFAGYLPNGYPYETLTSAQVGTGFDGDLSMTLVPGWQLIGSFYVGHDHDQNNQPISGSFDNSWSLFTRYDFSKESPAKGFSLGGGLTRVGSRWINDGGLTYSGYLPPNGLIKVQTGTQFNGFAYYQFNRHFALRLNCVNILNQAYPIAIETAYIIDPAPPRTWSLEAIFKF